MDHEVLERILDGRENPTNLSLSLLKDITENFSEDREIGHGGFATVYKIIDDTVGWVLCMDAHQTEPFCTMVYANQTIALTAVSKVKFIARKRWIVAASRDCFVHVYKYEKELETVTSFKVHDGDFVWCSLDVHPTQPYVLSGCFGQIKLWDWDQDWNCIQTFEKEHSDDIRELKFNPEDTNSFASASDDYTVKMVWSLDSPKSKYTLFGHSHHVYCLDFFKRDGQQYLISGSRDDTAKIWDLQKKECVHTLEHEYEVVCYVFAHPSLPVLITGGRDGAVRVWSSTDFRVCVILPVPPSAAWSDPGRELLAAPLQPALGRAVQMGRVFVQVLEEPLAKPAPESAPESVVLVVPMAEDVVAMVSVRDKVDDILSEIQLGSLLTHLEAASSVSGKTIVDKPLWKKSKKGGTTAKASVAACECFIFPRLKKKLEVGAPVYGLACLMGSERVAVAHFDGVSVMEIGDEEGQGGCEGSSNENSIAAIDS
uniref:Uncharacterized protein n=1 Tax=Aegilops tauschii TaxID=37682 RepID=M8CTH2_AEGTA